MKSELDHLLGAKRTWSARLLLSPRPHGFRGFAATARAHPEPNVLGVGVGEKFSGGKPSGVLALKFLVRRKYAEAELSRTELLPRSVDGLPADVEEVGVFHAFKKQPQLLSLLPNPRQRFRPAHPGCSLGFQFPPPSQMVMAGTFGAVVQDAQGVYILSNSHVLADEGRLAPGADVFQPGLLDGGKVGTDQIAKLTRFAPLRSRTMNQVDCAIARVTPPSLVSRDILLMGPPTGVGAAAIDMRVHKFGRTTKYTVGHITSIATDVTVGYETGSFTFADQILIVGDNGPFSAAGDSGSLILDRQSHKAVGLLFAGSETHTIANHLTEVLQALKVTLV